jgi:hypothetical protein
MECDGWLVSFIDHSKNYWKIVNDAFHMNVYINYNLPKALLPASCGVVLQEMVTNPLFLTSLVRDSFSLIDYEIDSSHILSVKSKAFMLSNGSTIRKHVDYPFEHKENEIVLKMVYYAHNIWDTSTWYGKFEFWTDNHITYQYDALPNRLVVFLSDNTSNHSISHIDNIPDNVYQNVIVFYVKILLK